MKKFKRIYIEITNVCNLQCSFCPPSKGKNKMMTVANFETVLKKLEGHGDYIYLHVKGEPLIHPNFEAILKTCEDYQKKVNITTNGTLLESQGQCILESPAIRQVSISLQSFEEMNNESAYLDYLDTVLKFVKKGIKETGIIFELRLWNFEDASLVLSEANQKTLTIIENALDLQESITFTVAKGKGIKLKKNVYLSKGYEFEWPDLDHDLVATKGTCYGLRQQIAVLSSGDVVPCCLDGEGAVTLGNIFESEFESIVTSSRASAIVSGFENNQLVEELCMRCGYRERFN